MQRFTFSIGERRLAHLMKEFGPNMKVLGSEMVSPFKEAAQDKDAFKMAMAPIAAGARAWLQGMDYAIAGIADRPVRPVSGSETWADTKQVAKDIVTLHPIKALVGVMKLPGDVGMDIIKTVGGFRGDARSQIQKTLAA